MDIQIEVTGGTHKSTRCTLSINGMQTGELTIMRSDFTKLCDILFQDRYTIKGKTPVNGNGE